MPRRPGRQLPHAVAQITAILRRGHRVLIFPEGTTTSGGPPSTFHRAGFQAAVDAAVPVVPVAIGYADGRGRPTTSAAFVGDDDLLSSLWRVLRAGPVVADVWWRPARRPSWTAVTARATGRGRLCGPRADRRSLEAPGAMPM